MSAGLNFRTPLYSEPAAKDAGNLFFTVLAFCLLSAQKEIGPDEKCPDNSSRGDCRQGNRNFPIFRVMAAQINRTANTTNTDCETTGLANKIAEANIVDLALGKGCLAGLGGDIGFQGALFHLPAECRLFQGVFQQALGTAGNNLVKLRQYLRRQAVHPYNMAFNAMLGNGFRMALFWLRWFFSFLWNRGGAFGKVPLARAHTVRCRARMKSPCTAAMSSRRFLDGMSSFRLIRSTCGASGTEKTPKSITGAANPFIRPWRKASPLSCVKSISNIGTPHFMLNAFTVHPAAGNVNQNPLALSPRFGCGSAETYGLFSFSQSRRALSMRDCQPGPVALKVASTSSDKRMLICFLRLARAGRPYREHG